MYQCTLTNQPGTKNIVKHLLYNGISSVQISFYLTKKSNYEISMIKCYIWIEIFGKH